MRKVKITVEKKTRRRADITLCVCKIQARERPPKEAADSKAVKLETSAGVQLFVVNKLIQGKGLFGDAHRSTVMHALAREQVVVAGVAGFWVQSVVVGASEAGHQVLAFTKRNSKSSLPAIAAYTLVLLMNQ